MDYPLVSVCTPTYNRRPFFPASIQCFRNQDYPRTQMEWIIIDDGTDKILDVLETHAQDLLDSRTIKYVRIDNKMTLGSKRNEMHKYCEGKIIVYWDDDDYYPKQRVSHAVETLMKHPNILIVGSSEIYVYYGHIQTMYKCGPYMENHATAGTFAFRRELLAETRYDDDAALAEEHAFLKEYTIPLVQLDPYKTILVFSHSHNSFDKKKMIDQVRQNPECQKIFRPCETKVTHFINDWKTTEKSVFLFFMRELEDKLEAYPEGRPELKPGLKEQNLVLDQQRKQKQQQQQQQQQQQVIMERPGLPPLVLTPQDIVNLLKEQNKEIERLRQRIQELETRPKIIPLLDIAD